MHMVNYQGLDSVLDYKTNISEFKRTKVIKTIFSEYRRINLEMNQVLHIIPKGAEFQFTRFEPCSPVIYTWWSASLKYLDCHAYQ